MSNANALIASNTNSELHAEILQLLQQLKRLNSVVPVQHRILRQLMYSSMHFREESIHNAESGTCKWIFEEVEEISASEQITDQIDEPREGKNNESLADELETSSLSENAAKINESQSNIDHDMSQQPGEEDVKDSDLAHNSFPNSSAKNETFGEDLYQKSQHIRRNTGAQFRWWLRSGKGIFHICGKPGSGKSTLMKFIRSQPRTRHELEQWAGCKELVLAYFYFSNNTGDESQMSLDSLYRSILFECLSQCPDLISEVFPSQWRNFNASNADSLLESNEFTKPKILDAFNILTSKRLNPRYRLCFFIDGLDEYHGDTYEHWKLARMLRDLSKGNDLKICASSRPHTEYLDTFCLPDHVRILLQDLNAYDIYVFSRKLLESDEKFPQIRDVYLDLAAQLSERSEGVFLWAVFAVRMILASLGYGDDPQTLARDLDIVPEQLDALFEKLLASISKQNRNLCDKFLCLTLMNPFNYSLAAVSYSWVKDLENPGFPPPDASPYSENEIMLREKSVERQLDRLTKGLLEIVETSSRIGIRPAAKSPHQTGPWKVVQFLHRTFREFLQERLQQNGFLQNFPSFTPGEIYGKIRLAEISYGCPLTMAQDIGLRAIFIVHGMYMLSPSLSNGLWGLPPAMTERLGLICRQTNFFVYCSNIGCRKFDSRDDIHGLFLYLAACSGHEEYICHQLEKDARLLKYEDESISMILSALHEGHTSLASKLLRQGGSVYRQISLHRAFPRSDHQFLDTQIAPIWLVAVYKALDYEFGVLNPPDNVLSLKAIQLWEFVQEHVVNSVDAEEWNCEVVIHATKSCVKLSDLLQMIAGYYSQEFPSYMKQECWQIVRCMSASTVQPDEYDPPKTPGEPTLANGSNLISVLKRTGGPKFEVKFHNYFMNHEWCHRLF